jgi:hypothetical protein
MLAAFPVEDDRMLLSWAERGRLRPDDYIVSPRLDVCVQAKEITELAEIFNSATLRRLRRISPALAWAAEVIRSLRGDRAGELLRLNERG